MKPQLRALAFVTLGFALLDVWCDVLGHGSSTAAAALAVADAFTNGRVFWNASLVGFCGALVLFPLAFIDHHRKLDYAAPPTAALFTLIYSLGATTEPAGVLPMICIIATGFCYGWLEARLFCEAARLARLTHVVIALAASRVMKALIAAFIGALADGPQLALDIVAVIGCGTCLVVASRILGEDSRPNAFSTWKLSPTDRSTFIAFLVLFPVLNAVARALSPLGFWGDAAVVGLNGVLRMVPAALLFGAVVALVFWKCDDASMFRRMACALLLLLGSLLLLDEATLSALGVPGELVQVATLAVELFSHFLFWLAAVMAVRALDWPPLRSAAMAELVMSSAAILFSFALQWTSALGRLIVVVSLYVVMAALMVVIWRSRELLLKTQAEHATDDETADATEAPVDHLKRRCAEVAEARNLSPRETEVLELLAEGRSRPYIQERLVISDATVKSHTNHVYQKLGVHSKQELIALIRDE